MAKNKIKKEELENLQKINGKLGQIKMALGEWVVQKRNHSASYDNLFKEWDKGSDELKEAADQLKEDYGNINLNLESGEYEIIPTADNKVEDDNQTDS
tara:strand:+ start:3054 stop:3347 length:294 start_codon:yes stop_codon:yes gene_type:complete